MKELVGKFVTGIYVSEDESFMKFDIKSEQHIIYHAYVDCCSETWFADIIVNWRMTNKDRDNYPLEVLNCEELDIPYWLQQVIAADGRGRQESEAVYGFKLTFKDHAWRPVQEYDITIIFRNSSNGYYGGEVLLADEDNPWIIKKLEEVEWIKIDSNWRS